ncbi:uncharacterized protein EV420DRAFT_1487589 [Desarmillaria tabescens]|uniref:Uncharacterized protein n=1 Tax=Armillaria tabescens TaxID=1929756 RepID=A0AA39MJT2_ARMTA|nr:uncharacterized protein EV420DRAFT_1487589 [Desarmillaria tabescens]KAK0436309.1 hypothetical protein EV420DRAFT_1487589 [Desarmillaria tabescens]
MSDPVHPQELQFFTTEDGRHSYPCRPCGQSPKAEQIKIGQRTVYFRIYKVKDNGVMPFWNSKSLWKVIRFCDENWEVIHHINQEDCKSKSRARLHQRRTPSVYHELRARSTFESSDLAVAFKHWYMVRHHQIPCQTEDTSIFAASRLQDSYTRILRQQPSPCHNLSTSDEQGHGVLNVVLFYSISVELGWRVHGCNTWDGRTYPQSILGDDVCAAAMHRGPAGVLLSIAAVNSSKLSKSASWGKGLLLTAPEGVFEESRCVIDHPKLAIGKLLIACL